MWGFRFDRGVWETRASRHLNRIRIRIIFRLSKSNGLNCLSSASGFRRFGIPASRLLRKYLYREYIVGSLVLGLIRAELSYRVSMVGIYASFCTHQTVFVLSAFSRRLRPLSILPSISASNVATRDLSFTSLRYFNIRDQR